jgi:UDP-GlcNAc:undecaprenyl-phosphate/decaprenyl-phosphate GlcNAc-1-phosphate transferase
MLQHALYASLAFGMSLALVPVCRTAATRFGYVARPRADRWHGRPTALLGGVAIAACVLIPYCAFVGVHAQPVLLMGVTLMFVVGLADDLVSFTPATKLVFEIAVAALFVFLGYRLSWVTSLTLDTILTLLWIVGLTNAFNLLDNMDGLAAGLCLIAGTSVLGSLLSGGVGGAEAVYLALLLGATAGFLVYNFHPASIFMGDSGSLFIGVSLAVLTLNSPTQTHASSNLLSVMAGPALILLVPILDTTLVTVSRLLSGRSAAQGGRDHSSHRLVAIGLSERAAVLVLWALAGLGGLLALAIKNYRNDWFSIGAALFVLGMMIFAVYLAHVRVYEDADVNLPAGGRFTPFVVNFVYRRRIAEVMLDLCLVAISYYSSYRLRFSGPRFGEYFQLFLQSLPLVLGVQILSLFAVGGYRGIWRYFGLMDGVTFAKGVGLGTLLNISLLLYVYRFQDYSRGVFIIHSALLMLLLSGSRASFRLISEFAHRRNRLGQRVVIYGVGDVAASVVRDMLGRRPGGYRMVGFIAEDPAMARMRMQGYTVLGNYATLTRYISEDRVDLVVITQPLDNGQLEQLRMLCADHEVALERLHFTLEQLATSP